MRVRSLYLDIQQWAPEDPSWVPWAVPSPVRWNDTQGYEKARRKTVAAMHQRVRERLPHLPALADAAGRCLAETTALLTAAAGCEPGEVFDHAGTRYRRKALRSAGLSARYRGNPSIAAENLVTGEMLNEVISTGTVYKRRAARPSGEYREPTDVEWQEFQETSGCARWRWARADALTGLPASMSTLA